MAELTYEKPKSRRKTKGRIYQRKPRTVRQCVRCRAEYVQDPWRVAPKYCSPKCYRAMQAERRLKDIKTARCAMCSAVVRRPSRKVAKKSRVFCSHECSHRYHVGPKSGAWRGGSELGRGSGWPKIAAAIRARDGYACRWCEKPQSENGGKGLSIDHVRPWRECESEKEANHPSNLVSLCASCHGKKARLERRWLRGDGLALQEYRRFVGISTTAPLFDNPLSPDEPQRLGPPIQEPDLKARGKAISAAKRTYYAKPGMTEFWSGVNKRKAQAPEFRAAISEKIRKRLADPVTRERMVAGMRAAKALKKAPVVSAC